MLTIIWKKENLQVKYQNALKLLQDGIFEAGFLLSKYMAHSWSVAVFFKKLYSKIYRADGLSYGFPDSTFWMNCLN